MGLMGSMGLMGGGGVTDLDRWDGYSVASPQLLPMVDYLQTQPDFPGTSRPMRLSLDQMLTEFDEYPVQIPLDRLVEGLKNLSLDAESLDQYMRFGDRCYQRNLLHEGPAYQALVLCWRHGQRSPIHDHRGSTCGVRVLRGTAHETVFRRTAQGFIYPVETVVHSEGSICGSEDADIHQVSNLSDSPGDLVTLHVYSPALTMMGRYTLEGPRREEFRESIQRLTHGAGI